VCGKQVTHTNTRQEHHNTTHDKNNITHDHTKNHPPHLTTRGESDTGYQEGTLIRDTGGEAPRVKGPLQLLSNCHM